MFDADQFYKMSCGVQHYAWGVKSSDGAVPYIADLVKAPAGEVPWAELWIGAHHRLPAEIECDGQIKTLEQAIAESPTAMIGAEAVAQGGILPFLLKVLSCSSPLSIQSHPDKSTAVKLHGAHPELYPDDNHKPEMMLALTDFEALCGFRGCKAIEADLTEHDVLRMWHDKWLATGADKYGLKGLCQVLFDFSIDEISSMCENLRMELSVGVKSDADGVFLHLLECYPNDRGVFFAYLLNHVRLNPGEAIFISANQPHAYLCGTGVECMANSDNVIRAGLTPKAVDVEALMETLDFLPSSFRLMQSVVLEKGIKCFLPPIDEFKLLVLQNAEIDVEQFSGQSAVILVLAGACEVQSGKGQKQTGGRGSIWYKPAGMNHGKIVCGENSYVVIACSNL